MSEQNQNAENNGGTNNSQSGGEGATNNQNAESKLEFNEVQRRWIENHGNEMFGKGAKKAEDTLTPKLSEASSKIEALTKEIDTLKAATKESGSKKKEQQSAEIEQIQQLQGRIEEMQAIVTRITSEKNEAVTKLGSYESERTKARKSQAFLSAIPDNIKFFSNDEVYTLLEPVVQEHEGQFVVINPKTGLPRLGNDLSSPMTLSEYISQFAAEKPHLVKAPDTDGGTGQGETRRTDTKTGDADVDKLNAAELEALIQKVKAGLA